MVGVRNLFYIPGSGSYRESLMIAFYAPADQGHGHYYSLVHHIASGMSASGGVVWAMAGPKKNEKRLPAGGEHSRLASK
eukprot:348639-Amphidinium_carterae.1